MENREKIKRYDVIIAGAGPAGCACALALKDSGLQVAMFDKYEFPRDKVCGDAIPGRALRALGDILPAYEQAFRQFPEKCFTQKTQFNYNGRLLERSWVREAYTCTRWEFDRFLFQLVEQAGNTEVFTRAAIRHIDLQPDGVTVTHSADGSKCRAGIIIGADGAHSLVAKCFTGNKMDRKHTVASVRAYYSGVLGIESDRTEVFFNKRFFPGYFWIFPLPGNRVNAGFGMLSDHISHKKINIKEAFYSFISGTPALAAKFKNAQQTGSLQGWGLPLGSKRVQVSGGRFLLTGDAASLIDPVSGDGIGNAMLSGRLAAAQVVKCFRENDFGSAHMKQYDAALFAAIGKELRLNAALLKISAALPALLDMAFWLGRAQK